MLIFDKITGELREYGLNQHDSLAVSADGKSLYYYNLQNGEGSRYGSYLFTDEEGKIPKQDPVLLKHGATLYFNIGGFKKYSEWVHDGSKWANRWICANCKYKLFDERTNYCPNCGASMERYLRGEDFWDKFMKDREKKHDRG